MDSTIFHRIMEETNYILISNKTIREIAKKFNVSKSTVHKDLTERLKKIDINIYKKVNNILKYHLSIRHINGGNSTKLKYLKIR